MSLLNYTTKIEADKTAGEIANMLRKAGARAVLTEYDENREYVSSLSFRMNVGGQDMGFRLPCDWKPVLQILENDNKVPDRLAIREQAVRVAWRIVHTWVKAHHDNYTKPLDVRWLCSLHHIRWHKVNIPTYE